MSPNMLFPGKQRLATVMLHRVGTDVEIKRADGTATENKYGKVSDTDVSWSTVANEVAYRLYKYKDDFPNESRALGGRVNTDNPFIAFPRDTDAQEDDRVVFADDNKEYVLDELHARQTHYEFQSTLVTD